MQSIVSVERLREILDSIDEKKAYRPGLQLIENELAAAVKIGASKVILDDWEVRGLLRVSNEGKGD